MKLTPLDVAAADAEYKAILDALKATYFNKSEAAKLLGVDRKTLYNKLKKHKEITGLLSAKLDGEV